MQQLREGLLFIPATGIIPHVLRFPNSLKSSGVLSWNTAAAAGMEVSKALPALPPPHTYGGAGNNPAARCVIWAATKMR